jgi:hypothetical protein
MLIPFRSKAAGDFFMQEPYVKTLFALMGKNYAAQGVIAAAEISMRLAQLQLALSQAQADQEPQITDTDSEMTPVPVGLKQRAWPLIDMLTRSEKKGVDVVWGNTI